MATTADIKNGMCIELNGKTFSVVEFLLPKPSYTIDTLRYLAENHGADMEFSILMGADQIERLDGWKEYDRILEYPA